MEYLPIIIATVCIFTGAFFSSTEIAMISADRAYIRRKAKEGNKGALDVEEFLTRPHRLLATTLLGTQLSISTCTVLVFLWLHRHTPQQVDYYLLLGLTPTIVIFGEIVPKAIVRQNATRFAPSMARVLKVVIRIFHPIVFLLTKLSEGVSKKLGIDLQKKIILREELESLITISNDSPNSLKKEGKKKNELLKEEVSDVTENERSMISRIFEISELIVEDIRVPLSSVVALPEDASMEQMIEEVVEKKYSRIPIYRERVDQIVGVLNAFDVLREEKSKLKASQLMRYPLYVPQSQRAVDLLQQLQQAGQSIAVVVDEYGGAIGIATIEDIIEKIVGEIGDEYDDETPKIYQEKQDTYLISGDLSIEKLNQELHLALPYSEEYLTIAGLLLEKVRRIPKIGEEIKMDEASFVIIQATDRRIEQVRLILVKTS